MDWRVELFCAVRLVARPSQPPAPARAYARGLAALIRRFRYDPAFRIPAGGLEGERALLSLLLNTSGVRSAPSERFGLDARRVASWLAALAALARRSDFKRRWSELGARRAFPALARRESRNGQPAESVTAYLRLAAPPCRFIVAPLLSWEHSVNVEAPSAGRAGARRLRGAWVRRGELGFQFDRFDCSIAHEIAHLILGPWVWRARAAWESWPGRPPRGCNGGMDWTACAEEHLVLAVTLRALALEGRGEEASRYLSSFGRPDRYPFLSHYCALLQGYEKTPPREGSFADYFPRLTAWPGPVR